MDVEELETINEISFRSDNIEEIRKGAWSTDEDSVLINYVSVHGEGRWNHLARNSGLKRTGKSCRLRWKNYLQPNVRRGNFTLEEQLRIIELHCLYGNRWSKIAEFLPGRTDNEIKNYWRTRVQKQAKQLKCDINSIEFRDFIRNIWLPRLYEQIHASNCKCNNLDNELTNTYVVEINGPDQPLQMDCSARTLSSDVVEAQQVSVIDNLYKNDACFSGMDFGQDCVCSPVIGYDFQGSENLAWFNYREVSNILHPEDYTWAYP